MKTIIIFGHPNFMQSHVSKGWYQQIKEALPEAHLHVLSELYPTANFDVVAEQELLKNFDRIILIYPVYWFDTPWLLQKWMEEVLVHPFYAQQEALLGKELQIALSTGSVEENYILGGLNGFPLDIFLLKMQAITHKCRMKYRPHYVFYNAMAPDMVSRMQAEKEQFLSWITSH